MYKIYKTVSVVCACPVMGQNFDSRWPRPWFLPGTGCVHPGLLGGSASPAFTPQSCAGMTSWAPWFTPTPLFPQAGWMRNPPPHAATVWCHCSLGEISVYVGSASLLCWVNSTSGQPYPIHVVHGLPTKVQHFGCNGYLWGDDAQSTQSVSVGTGEKDTLKTGWEIWIITGTWGVELDQADVFEVPEMFSMFRHWEALCNEEIKLKYKGFFWLHSPFMGSIRVQHSEMIFISLFSFEIKGFVSFQSTAFISL